VTHPNGASADERSLVATPRWDDDRSGRVIQLAHAIHFCLRCGEERFAKPERHRACNNDQFEIKQINNIARGPTDQAPSTSHSLCA
jgi:hypothetical protein